MDYNEVLQRARARMAPRCKVCPECNGLGCGNTMPGPGSKAPGNGANDNWRAWRRWCLNMDTIAPNTPVDTSLELLGRTFSLPVIAAPIGSLRAQFHPEDDIRDYNACCIAAAAQTGIAASFGDGLDARVFPHGCALSQQYGGIGLPVINPLSMDTIKANLDLANAAQPFAVSVVIDSAGLPHLKAASPDAGSKTVAELRELCDYAQMPMILKGIMTVRGAEKAVEAGAAAIVVSNHGGRDVHVRRALPQRHHARHGARTAVSAQQKAKQLRSLGFAAVFALTGAGCAGCGHSAAAKWARRPTAASCRD